MKDKKLTMIGNAHLDPVWLWNWQEGFQAMKATVRSALDRMQEDERFVFTCSSAGQYEWIEKSDPAMFEEIKARVKEGRWEIVGGWWTQPDCNIPSGESFVRQGLYGQRYFLEKFGQIAETGYNVDSFGHNGNLPQILRQSGMKNYVFMRPMPLEKGLPGRIFRWASRDGSEVLSYRIPYEYCSWGKDLRKYTERLLVELEDSEDHLMMFYGVGNHGGGPTRENLRSIHAMNEEPGLPILEMNSTSTFFDAIREADKEYPTYTGDLQHHASGCYSVHSQVKRENRRAERMLTLAEAWSAIAASTGHHPYPVNFGEAWKGVLFNQFHDVLAGTSLPSAYDDASYLYGQAMAISQTNLNFALQAISWNINIEEDVTMRPIVVFNSHPWKGKIAVELEIRGLTNDSFRLTDSEGTPIAAQRVQSESTVSGSSRLLFLAELPSVGYEVFKLYLNQEETPVFENVSISEYVLENERWRFELDPVTGFAESYVDKRYDLEIFRRPGARLTVYEDRSDTWSHNVFKFDKVQGDMVLDSIRILEEGPVRSVLRAKYSYGCSRVIQDFRLYRELDYIEVKVRVDWRTPLTMLKLRFPVNLNFRKPTYEIPFGYIEKSANGEEEPGQTWVDCSGEHFLNSQMYGLALANDAKYSYTFDIDEMRLTVLKNAVYAHHDPKELDEDTDYVYTDDGFQTFSYLLLPHEGGWKTSEIVKRANELNMKPQSIIESYHAGDNPQRHAFLELDSDHIVISAIKESEDGDGLIIRAYETHNKAGLATLRIPHYMMTYDLEFEPSEIKTVKIPYSNPGDYYVVNMLELPMGAEEE